MLREYEGYRDYVNRTINRPKTVYVACSDCCDWLQLQRTQQRKQNPENTEDRLL